MAGEEKTEKPTGKRLQEALNKGQVARSADLNGALVLLAGLIAIAAFAPAAAQGVAGAMRAIFTLAASPGAGTSGPGLKGLEHIVETVMLTSVAPIAGCCCAVGVLSNVAQLRRGAKPRMNALRPSFDKLNPINGVKNLFGAHGAVETLKAFAKLLIVGGLAATALLPQLTHLAAGVGTGPAALGTLMHDNVISIAERVALGYLLIGVVDYIYQKRRVGKQLKMTKQEVKEEGRQSDLPPEIKGAIRRRQMQAARARMMAAVPQADVVVTNPTHYAVALKYDGSKPAPIVIAKGKDNVALQIRRIAEEHDVPIVPDPPLARTLHANVEIDQMIPAELYAAVAQVLAFVYRMAGRRKAYR